MSSSRFADRPTALLQGRLREAAGERSVDVDTIIARAEELALARVADRPAPVYVLGSAGSGARRLTAMMAAALPVIDLGEAMLPVDLLGELELLDADEQGLVVDCVHLIHALALCPDASLAEVLEARMLSSAVETIEPRHRRWDADCFAIHLRRDPREQATSIAFHRRRLREKYFPAVPDDRLLIGCAANVAEHMSSIRRSGIQPDFVCRHEDLEKSAPTVLVELAAALGHPLGLDAATRIASRLDASSAGSARLSAPRDSSSEESRAWQADPDECQKVILHSRLVDACVVAGYPVGDCLGQPLKMNVPRTERRLRFSDSESLGAVFVREGPVHRGGTWTRLADACGEIVVPGGVALKLRLSDSASRDAIASLAQLGSNDLDSLCLAGNPTIDDELLATILAGPSGVQELDLACTDITYAAMSALTALPGLRGLSVAATALSPGDTHDLRAALKPPGIVVALPVAVQQVIRRRRRRSGHGLSPAGKDKALITGCPRSGTSYIASVLSWAGVASGHEFVYGPGGAGPWCGATVDVSWLAAPLLPVKGVPAAHQVRDPLAVIRSLVGTRFFEIPSPFRRFAEEACPRLREEGSSVAAAVRMWCEWTRMAEAHAVARWRVEDVATQTHRIAAHVGASPDRLRRVIEHAPQDINHRRRARELDLASVPRRLWGELAARAADFGYEVSR